MPLSLGKRARYSLTDNNDGSLTFAGNDIPPHDTWVFPRPEGNPHGLKESNWTIKVRQSGGGEELRGVVRGQGGVGQGVDGCRGM